MTAFVFRESGKVGRLMVTTPPVGKTKDELAREILTRLNEMVKQDKFTKVIVL